MSVSLDIDIWADIACPWCYIGERRLKAALAARPEVSATIRWRPFQLQPGLPPEGIPWNEFVPVKFGGMAEAAFAQVAKAGASDGITFHFDRVASAFHTADTHRLILLAEGYGKGEAITEALFAAYFTDGIDLARRESLLEIAAAVGLASEVTEPYLAGDTGKHAVAESQQAAQAMRVTGVPFTLLSGPGGQFALAGAMPVEAFIDALDRAAGSGI